MHIYKLVCKVNKKTYIGLSELEPYIDDLDLPKSVQEDLIDYGKDKFNLLKICELNNKEKAEFRAETLAENEEHLYEEDPEESIKVEEVEPEEE